MTTLMKTGPYNPIKGGLSKYESYQLITAQKYDPPLNVAQIKKCLKNVKVDLGRVDHILVSALKRAQQTAQYLIDHDLVSQSVSVEMSPYLDEIKFNMTQLCSLKEYKRQGSNIVRQRFVSAFINNHLSESHKDIKNRFDCLTKRIAQLATQDKNTLCVSHSFFIKLYCLYRKYPKLFEKPSILKENFNPRRRIMEFCEIIII